MYIQCNLSFFESTRSRELTTYSYTQLHRANYASICNIYSNQWKQLMKKKKTLKVQTYNTDLCALSSQAVELLLPQSSSLLDST